MIEIPLTVMLLVVSIFGIGIGFIVGLWIGMLDTDDRSRELTEEFNRKHRKK